MSFVFSIVYLSIDIVHVCVWVGVGVDDKKPQYIMKNNQIKSNDKKNAF